MVENTLLYKSLKKDLEQKAIVAADPATTAMVVTKSEFKDYKDQTQQTLQTMKDATAKAQETVDNVIQGHTPLKGVVVYRDDIADNNGIAITENQDSNLAIYKVNQDGSASDVKLLLNNKEVAMKSDLKNYATQEDITYLKSVYIMTEELVVGNAQANPRINNLTITYENGNPSLTTNANWVLLQTKNENSSPIATTDFVERRIQQIPNSLEKYVEFDLMDKVQQSGTVITVNFTNPTLSSEALRGTTLTRMEEYVEINTSGTISVFTSFNELVNYANYYSDTNSKYMFYTTKDGSNYRIGGELKCDIGRAEVSAMKLRVYYKLQTRR